MIMRYQPNHESGFFVRRLINHFIVRSAVINATMPPMISKDHSGLESDGVERSSKILAPRIVGTPRRNENVTI